MFQHARRPDLLTTCTARICRCRAPSKPR
jgi:hypothetical protein